MFKVNQVLPYLILALFTFFGTLSCDESKSCGSNQDCSEGFYCDLEGYCTQLTAFVRCGDQKCFAPEVCVNGQSCMVVEQGGANAMDIDIPLAGMTITDSSTAGMTPLDAQLDQGPRDMSDGYTYIDLEFRDMSPPRDMETDPLMRDQGGQDCQSPCDCPPGLGCVSNSCTVSPTPIYCCGSNACPPGETCQTTDGVWDRCSESSCATACDCDPGLGCIAGQCALGDYPLFCCDQGSCPNNMACENRQGIRGMCPARACTTACDCPSGQRCVNESCILTEETLFCCDQGSCPSGSACQSTSGTYSTCQDGVSCTTACDCMAGLSCIDGACILAESPLFCCENSFCPAGERCESSLGGPLLMCGD